MMTLTVVVALLALKFMVSLADQAIVESDLDRLMTLAGSGESGAERAAWFPSPCRWGGATARLCQRCSGLAWRARCTVITSATVSPR